jgi:hypothetical protein
MDFVEMISGPKNKLIKAQFNNLCTAAVVCEMNNIVITAGSNLKTSLIDVSDNGIYVQPGAGKYFTVGTYNIKGPLHIDNPLFLNRFLPGVAQAPSARFNLDLMGQGIRIGAIVSSLGVIL